MSTLPTLRAVVSRDLLLYVRRPGEWLTPLMFFVMVTLVFPLGLSPDPVMLATIAPGLIWVAALLASLVSLNVLFGPDFDDGALEELVLSEESLTLIALARVFAHWLVTGLPLVILAPFMAVFFGFPEAGREYLVITLLLGTPVLSLLGAIGAALTVSLRAGGMLVPILILPLAVPVLIFGAKGVALAVDGEVVSGPLYMLGFLLALGLSLGPLAIAGALRISLE
ncbi:MAG: heme exporter protein CcmB [Gammaproteobacteria bacterium]